MADTFDLTKQIKIVNAHSQADALEGPYNSIAEALTGVPFVLRKLGRTVKIITGSNVDEYWFKNGITDNDLILKIPNIAIPQNTSDLTNDGEDGTSPYATENYVDLLHEQQAAVISGKADLVSGKVPQSQSQPSNIVYNSSNGVITFTDATGTITTIDLPVENLFQNASYNSTTKILTLTTNGGGTIDVDLSTLVDLPEVVIATSNPGSAPTTGQKLYFNTINGQYWMNSGGTWTSPGIPLQLGETNSTAYRGDRGKIGYDHSQITGNPHNTTKADVGLGNVDNVSDANKPVSSPQAAAINTAVTGKEDNSNKSQNLGTSSTQYPSLAALNKGINKVNRIINSSSTGFSGSTYTVQSDDKDYWLQFDFATATNIQFTNANTTIADEWECETIGNGQLTIIAGSGATMTKAETSTVKTLEKGAVFGIKKIAATTFHVFGRLEQVLGEEIKNSENIQIITATPSSPLVAADFGTNGGLTIYANATSGNIIITLPISGTWTGKILSVVKTDSSANSVTVKGAGSELINSSNTDVLNTLDQSKMYKNNGTKTNIF